MLREGVRPERMDAFWKLPMGKVYDDDIRQAYNEGLFNEQSGARLSLWQLRKPLRFLFDWQEG
jgi:hypothetical protein